MPTKNKRLTLIPDTESLAVCGRDIRPDDEGRWSSASQQVNGVIKRHAMLIEQAGRELGVVLTRGEWNLIADVNNGCADLYDYSGSDIPALSLIAANVSDGDTLDGAGRKWKVNVPDLLAKLAALSPTHGEAIADAVRWFWDHSADIDHTKDQWWLPSFRRKAVEEKE